MNIENNAEGYVATCDCKSNTPLTDEEKKQIVEYFKQIAIRRKDFVKKHPELFKTDVRMDHLNEMTPEDHIRYSEEVLAHAEEYGVAVFNGKNKMVN